MPEPLDSSARLQDAHVSLQKDPESPKTVQCQKLKAGQSVSGYIPSSLKHYPGNIERLQPQPQEVEDLHGCQDASARPEVCPSLQDANQAPQLETCNRSECQKATVQFEAKTSCNYSTHGRNEHSNIRTRNEERRKPG